MSFDERCPSFDGIYKVIIIGDYGVGKTSLLRQYVESRFLDRYTATVGADFKSRKVKVDNKTIELQLWDTAGQERFNSLGHAFYRGAECCVIVFDLTNRESFTRLDFWKEGFLEQAGKWKTEEFPFVLVGNKADKVNERKVSYEETSRWAGENNMLYFETSAKDKTQIEGIFMEIANKASIRIDEIREESKRLFARKEPSKRGCKCLSLL